MIEKDKILAIIGSTRSNSSNLKLIKKTEELIGNFYELVVFENIADLPHFNPDLDNEKPPIEIIKFRNLILESKAVIICTPEYIFSLPGSLKNAFEWCVSTTIFTRKPVGLITASANGEKGHEELILIMNTLGAINNHATCLLIKGIKGKFDQNGSLIDFNTIAQLQKFVADFIKLLKI